MILDAHGGRPRRLRLRPVYLILALIVLLTAGAGLDHWLVQRRQQSANPLPPQYLHNQRLLVQAQHKLAETQAELSLRDERLAGLQEEMARQRLENERLKQRLQLYDTILQGRKGAGVHILKADAMWLDEGAIGFDVVLVKGGNYPRRVAGSLRIVAKDDQGHEVVVKAGDKHAELPYRMESHTFLHGSLRWKHAWQPQRLLFIRLNRKGEIREQVETPIRKGA